MSRKEQLVERIIDAIVEVVDERIDTRWDEMIERTIGVIEEVENHPGNADWKDQIPWKYLVDEIQWIAWNPKHCCWVGYSAKPLAREFASGTPYYASSDGDFFNLAIVKLPFPPTWLETLVERPGE